MSENDESTPYDEKTLYRMAEAAAKEEGVPQRWHEDAVAEYVAHAYKAGLDSDRRGSVQAYQCRMGRGAIQNFLRRERRQEALTPASCTKHAKRVSLDKMVLDSGGEWIPLVETIEDKEMPQPDARMLREERDQAVRRALGRLSPKERQAFKMVVLEGKTQEKAAERMRLSRDQVRYLVETATRRLRLFLADYEDEYNRCRLPND